jgi:plastocyanin
MSRTIRIALVAAVIGLALALTAGAPAAPAQKTAQGTVGPGFTIKLTLGGKKVTTLRKGVRYRFLIRDRSSAHDFHLMGPGLNRVLTTVGFMGTKSYVFTLKKGTYRFVCDPHAAFMHGSFRVS